MPSPSNPRGECATLLLSHANTASVEGLRAELDEALARGTRTLFLRPSDTLTKSDIDGLRSVLGSLNPGGGRRSARPSGLYWMIEDDVLLAKKLMAHGVLFTQKPTGCSFERIREVLGSTPLIGLCVSAQTEVFPEGAETEIDFYYVKDSGELKLRPGLKLH